MPLVDFRPVTKVYHAGQVVNRMYSGGAIAWQNATDTVLVAGDGLFTVVSLAPISTITFTPGDQKITVSEV